MGEVLPRYENHVRIDRDVKDAWGIPALHIQARYTDNEFEMAKDAMNTAAEIAAGGFRAAGETQCRWFLPARASTSSGTCRHGIGPEEVGAESIQPVHEVKNLFVVDGSCICFGRISESNSDDTRTCDASVGVYGRGDAQRHAVEAETEVSKNFACTFCCCSPARC